MTAERAGNRSRAILERLAQVEIDPQRDLTPLGRRMFGLEGTPLQ